MKACALRARFLAVSSVCRICRDAWRTRSRVASQSCSATASPPPRSADPGSRSAARKAGPARLTAPGRRRFGAVAPIGCGLACGIGSVLPMRMSAGFGADANFCGPSLAACLGALRFGARLVRTEFLLERSVQSFGPGLGVFGARLRGLRLRLGGLRAPLRSLDPLLGLTGPRLGVLRPRLLDPLIGVLHVGLSVPRDILGVLLRLPNLRGDLAHQFKRREPIMLRNALGALA